MTDLFKHDDGRRALRKYRPVITASENQKGVLDVDTVKGCACGMARYSGGCYEECYANKTAHMYGIDFGASVTRKATPRAFRQVFFKVKEHSASWYRIGTFGDPSHDWDATIDIIERLHPTGKKAVIITKHWNPLSMPHMIRLLELGAVVNTSTSALDTQSEIEYRLDQFLQLKALGVKSVLRVVTCKFGDTNWGREKRAVQGFLLSHSPVIDNPLRASKSNPRVISGDIILERRNDSIGGGKLISIHNDNIYIGHCSKCPDQCGA